jgi:hypothetical protein
MALEYRQLQSSDGWVATPAAERQLTVAVGFSPRTAERTVQRRVVTLEPGFGCTINRSVVASRLWFLSFVTILRGLKPTATIVVSLRESGENDRTLLRRYT